MGQVEPPIVTAELLAPATGRSEAWHSAEATRAKNFCWSNSARLQWSLPELPQYPAHLYVRLPFLLEAREGFAIACRATICGTPCRMSFSHSAILADARLESGLGLSQIVVETPSLCSSFELRGAPDARPLGLAVPVAKAAESS